jgi:GT2 family glycosyltransferase
MITVVVVNWNSGEFLEKCLVSLERLEAPVEIVVIDNASTDGSLGFLDRAGSRMLVLRNSRNMGFAAGCNAGWRRTEGDPVLFLNPDTECAPGSVSLLADCLARDEGIWAAGGNLVNRNGKTQAGFNVRRFPTVGSLMAEMLLLDEIWPGNPWSRRYRMRDWDHGSPRDVDQPAAACLMVRRHVLERLEGFDESFFPVWFEDVDLCRRIRNHGGRISFRPEARFLHYGGCSLARLSQGEFLEHFHRNQIRYFGKHHGVRAARRARSLAVTGLRLRAFLSLIHPVLPDQSRGESARTFALAARRIAGVAL